MTEIVLNFTDQNVEYLGEVASTGVSRIDLSALGLTHINSFRIEDDNVISGGTGAASGYDLDFVKFSKVSFSSALEASNISDTSIDYHSTIFQAGYRQPYLAGQLSAWNATNMFGTDSSGEINLDETTFSVRDYDDSVAGGVLSLGESGSIQFNAPALATTSLYMYIGNADSGNAGFSVVISDQPTITDNSSLTLKGDSGNNEIYLGRGDNQSIGHTNDLLYGLDGDDRLYSAAGNDVLVGGNGDDFLDGGTGLDTSMYSGTSSDFNWSIYQNSILMFDPTGTEGTDTLYNIERVSFNNINVAFDLGTNEHAGMSAQLLTAAFGSSALYNKEFASIAIHAFDSGSSLEQVSQLAVDSGLVSAPNNTSFVSQVWDNVVESVIDEQSLNYYVALLETHVFTQASLLAMASQTDLTQGIIQTLGIANTGWEYAIIE